MTKTLDSCRRLHNLYDTLDTNLKVDRTLHCTLKLASRLSIYPAIHKWCQQAHIWYIVSWKVDIFFLLLNDKLGFKACIFECSVYIKMYYSSSGTTCQALNQATQFSKALCQGLSESFGGRFLWEPPFYKIRLGRTVI